MPPPSLSLSLPARNEEGCLARPQSQPLEVLPRLAGRCGVSVVDGASTGPTDPLASKHRLVRAVGHR